MYICLWFIIHTIAFHCQADQILISRMQIEYDELDSRTHDIHLIRVVQEPGTLHEDKHKLLTTYEENL